MCVQVPMIVHRRDLLKIAPLWLAKTMEIRNDRENWPKSDTSPESPPPPPRRRASPPPHQQQQQQQQQQHTLSPPRPLPQSLRGRHARDAGRLFPFRAQRRNEPPTLRPAPCGAALPCRAHTRASAGPVGSMARRPAENTEAGGRRAGGRACGACEGGAMRACGA